ncbi:hypothetical protein JW964_14540 [candidate division KSB1 bacterium]|nr:hypothetical protein [candidate division KSB1 bacterium]
MNQFVPLLKKISDRLDLPQPTKSHIILEIAGDLDDLFEHYLARGLSREEAFQKTQEKFDLTDDALEELVEIHQSFLKRLFDKLSTQAQTWWERVMLLLVLLTVASIGGQSIITTQLFRQASPFVWPITGIFTIILSISLVKFYQLYIKKDHKISNLHRGLPTILLLGGVNLFLGIYGYIIELYTTNFTTTYSGAFDVITTVINSENEPFFRAVTHVMQCAAMAMICTLVTIITGIIWYFLMKKIRKIEQAEVTHLFSN